MNEEIIKLQKEIEELKSWKKSLENASSIPLAIDQSFRKRFSVSTPIVSSKGATTENQAVDEGGSATFSVLKAPDGFLQMTIGTTVYYIPIFT